MRIKAEEIYQGKGGYYGVILIGSGKITLGPFRSPYMLRKGMEEHINEAKKALAIKEVQSVKV